MVPLHLKKYMTSKARVFLCHALAKIISLFVFLHSCSSIVLQTAGPKKKGEPRKMVEERLAKVEARLAKVEAIKMVLEAKLAKSEAQITELEAEALSLAEENIFLTNMHEERARQVKEGHKADLRRMDAKLSERISQVQSSFRTLWTAQEKMWKNRVEKLEAQIQQLCKSNDAEADATPKKRKRADPASQPKKRARVNEDQCPSFELKFSTRLLDKSPRFLAEWLVSVKEKCTWR